MACLQALRASAKELLHLSACVLTASVATWLMYSGTLGYGFNYDDYHFVRPFPPAEIRAAFHGPWDPAGIEVPFYRPLTIVLYAARFELFGLNSAGHHACSLAMFAVAATLFGIVLTRFLGSRTFGLLGLGIFVVHPAMPYSAVAWITNQMHLLQLVVVLAALLWWELVRRRSAIWWMPLLLCGTAALMIKEDGIMLLPAIVMLHVIRRRLVEPDLPYPPSAFVVSGVLVLISLLVFRSRVLHGLGGYPMPTLDGAWMNYTRGLESVLRLVPAKRPWQPAASWLVTVLPVVALLGWPRISPPVRFGLVAGIAFAALFNLPFVFVVKVQQLHLVAAGASMLLASACAAIWQMAAARRLRPLGLGAALAGIALLATVTRDITRDFEPFGRIILATDDLVTGWAAVPGELRAFLGAKKEPDAASRLSPNPADALELVAFGVHGMEGGGSVPRFRWMAGARTEIHVRASARAVRIPLRCEVGAAGGSARARIDVDGRTLDHVTFDSGDWRMSDLPLLPASVSPLRRMHRIVVHVDRTWVPAQVDPASRDERVLGLQIGEIAVR